MAQKVSKNDMIWLFIHLPNFANLSILNILNVFYKIVDMLERYLGIIISTLNFNLNAIKKALYSILWEYMQDFLSEIWFFLTFR